MEIFKLFGSILIDDEEANKSIAKTEKNAKSLGERFKDGIKTVGKWGAALTGAAVAGGAALLGMANKAAETTDAIHKGSQRMGVSTKAYQEMEYWASQNGLAQGQLEKAVGRLNQRMGMAKDGNEKYSNALENLGVNMDDVRKGTLSTEDAFAQSIKSLSEMTNEQDKAALASELFGTKLGRDLLPTLQDGSLSFEDAKKKAQELGIVLDEDSINAGVNFTDTMDNVKRSLGTVVTTVGADVMPIIQVFLDWILENMPLIQSIVGTVFEKIGEFVQVAVDIFQNILIPAFEQIFEWVEEYWPEIQEIINNVIDGIVEIIQGFIKLFKTIWEKWGDDIKVFVETTFSAIKTVIDTAMNVIKNVIDTVTALISGDWEGVWNGIKNTFKSVWDGIAQLLPTLLEAVYKVIRDAFGTFKGLGKKMFENIWEGMKGIWTSITTWVSEKVEWLSDKLAFWRRGNDEMDEEPDPKRPRNPSPHGSHRSGLEYVPFDGYRAELHKGERILTAEENKGYNEHEPDTNQEITINTPVYLDGKKITTVTSRVQLQNNKGKARALGVNPS